MIDFKKELAKFSFFAVDKELANIKNETAVSFKLFDSTLRQIRKEHGDVVFQTEEIISILDEMKESINTVSLLQNNLAKTETEKNEQVTSFIAVLDQFEDYYRYIRNNAGESWNKQFAVLWANVGNLLLAMGVVRIEPENALFSSNLCLARQISYNEELPDGIVTEVIRCGYIYNSVVLRKAEVTVNKAVNRPEISVIKAVNKIESEPLNITANETPSETPSEPPHEPANEPLNEPANEPPNEPPIEPPKEPAIEPPNEPANETLNKPVTEQGSETFYKAVNEPVNEAGNGIVPGNEPEREADNGIVPGNEPVNEAGNGTGLGNEPGRGILNGTVNGRF